MAPLMPIFLISCESTCLSILTMSKVALQIILLSRYYFSTCVTYHFLANLLYIKIKNNNIIKKDVQINNTLYEFIKLWLRHNRYTSFLVGSCDLIPTPDCAKSRCKSIKVICNESISNFRVQNTGMMPCQNNINVVQSKKNNLQSAMF